MSGPRKLYEFLMAASMAHARWDYEVSMNILRNRKKLLWLLALATPILAVSALSEHSAFHFMRKENFKRAQFRDVLQRALQAAPLADVEPIAATPAPK